MANNDAYQHDASPVPVPEVTLTQEAPSLGVSEERHISEDIGIGIRFYFPGKTGQYLRNLYHTMCQHGLQLILASPRPMH